MFYLPFGRVIVLFRLVLCVVLGAVASPLAAMVPITAQPVQSEVVLSQPNDNHDEKQAEADRLYYESVQLGRTSHGLEALRLLEQAWVLYREVGDRQGEANALMGFGAIAEAFGEYTYSLEHYQQALVIRREIGDRAGEGSTLNNIGGIHLALSDYLQALDYYQQALEISRETGNLAGEGDTLSNIGVIHFSLGDYPQSLDYYQQALEISIELNDRAGEGTTLNNIGFTYLQLGDYRKAFGYYQQALEISREIGNLVGEGRTLTGIGSTHHKLGDYPQALDYYQQSLEISREISDRAGEGTTLNNIGIIYYLLGDYSQALHNYEQALEIRREIGNREGEVSTLNSIGLIYSHLGSYPQASSIYLQALEISREIGDRAAEGATLNNIGFTFGQLGNYPLSLGSYVQALVISREIGDRAAEGASLNNIGFTYGQLGDYSLSLDVYQQALEILREIGDLAGEGVTLHNVGTIFLLTEQFPQAEYALAKAIHIRDELRDADLKPSERISLFERQRATYQVVLQTTLMAQEKSEQALEVSEQGRARVLADQLIETLNNENAGFASTSVPDINEIRRITQQQNATLVSYSIVLGTELYIWVVSPDGEINVEQVPLTDDGSIDFTAVSTLIQPDAPFYRNRSQTNTPADTLAADTRSALGVGRGIGLTPIGPAETTDRLQQLHHLLIDPIQKYLPTDPTEKVIFIPQDDLFSVPFPALQDQDETYLIEKHTILTAPSIQVLGLTPKLKQAQSSPSGTPLIVGNPTMPFTWNRHTDENEQLDPLANAETEAITIANLFNTQALIGNQATEAAIKQRITQAPLIHFATHGLLEYRHPEDSGVLDVPGAIALAPGNGENGLLTSAELLEMDLNADLVVLSACDTGRGRVTGDGVIGLSRSLITAGVPSVVVSLWSVPGMFILPL